MLGELLPLVGVSCQRQALTLAEVQQAGLHVLLELLPATAAGCTAHVSCLQLLHR